MDEFVVFYFNGRFGPGSEKNLIGSFDKVLLYPNPTSASISITLPKEMETEGMTYQISDMSGKALAGNGSNNKITGRYSEITLERIPPGIYFINLIDGNGNQVESIKFVKQ